MRKSEPRERTYAFSKILHPHPISSLSFLIALAHLSLGCDSESRKGRDKGRDGPSLSTVDD